MRVWVLGPNENWDYVELDGVILIMVLLNQHHSEPEDHLNFKLDSNECVRLLQRSPLLQLHKENQKNWIKSNYNSINYTHALTHCETNIT